MVDKYPLALNINMAATRDWNWLIEACKLLNSSHQMAMISASNNPRADIDSVMRLHAAIGDSQLQWFIRVYSPLEGDWHKVDIQAYVNYCAEIHRHFPNVIFDAPSNEPGVPDDRVEAFIDNQVALIEMFASRGIRYAACCYGMGSPHHEHVTSGRYDKLLKTIDKHYNTTFLSEHHYSMGWLEAGSGYGYDILLDPAKLPQFWRNKWTVQEGHYLIRRSDYWALRADKLGIRRPRVYLSESPFDQNPDAVSQLNNRHGGVWDRIRNQYGLQKYNFDLRGLNTYEKYWKAVYPQLTYDESLAKLLIHFVEDCLHVDYMVCAFMFAWNTYWDIPMGTDISIPERKPTIRLLSEHAKTYVKSPNTTPTPDPIPAPTIETEAKRIHSNTVGLRLRAKPSAKPDSPTLATFPQLVWLGAKVSKQRWQADGYSWAYVEVTLDGVLYKGYAADQYLSIETVEPEIDLTVTELELVMAFREQNHEALVRLIDNANVVLLDETEQAILSAYEDRDVRKLLTFVLSVTP